MDVRTPVLLAVAVAVAAVTPASSTTAAPPAVAARPPAAVAPAPDPEPAARVVARRPDVPYAYVVGVVLDGRGLATDPDLVIPNDLPPVEGATVELLGTGRTVTSRADGRFSFGRFAAKEPCVLLSVRATKAGFGTFEYRRFPVYVSREDNASQLTLILLATPVRDTSRNRHTADCHR